MFSFDIEKQSLLSVSLFGAFTIMVTIHSWHPVKEYKSYINLLSPFFPLFFSWGAIGIWIQDLCSPLWKNKIILLQDKSQTELENSISGSSVEIPSLELIRMKELPCSVHKKQWSWKTEAAGSRDEFLTKKSVSPITSIGKKFTWTDSRSFGLRESRQNEQGTDVSWTVRTNKRTLEIYPENFFMLWES